MPTSLSLPFSTSPKLVPSGSWLQPVTRDTIWLKYWSEGISSAIPTHSNYFYLGFYALFQVCLLVLLFLLCITVFKSIVHKVGARLHNEALKTVSGASLKYLTATDTGDMTALLSQDMTLIDAQLPGAFVNLATSVFSSLGMAAVITSFSPFFMIAYPIFIAVLYALQKFYLRTSRQLRLLDLKSRVPLYTHSNDTMKSIVTIRAIKSAVDHVKRNNELLDISQTAAYLMAMIQRWLAVMLQLIVAALALLIVTMAVQLRSSTAFTGASLVTLLLFGEQLSHIIQVYAMLETSIGAVSRLKSFGEDVPSEVTNIEDVPEPGWPSKGNISLTGVSAAYESSTVDLAAARQDPDSEEFSQAPKFALKNLTLSVPAGEKGAVCGRTGSGKSSLNLLLLRLLDPLSSSPHRIIIDDISLCSLDRAIVRQRIIAIPQEPVLMPDGCSFMENLDPQGVSDEAECRAVLERVQLLKLVDGNGGVCAAASRNMFSQGQKQLLGLARAILRRRTRLRQVKAGLLDCHIACKEGGILLLDEISSNVDQATELVMQAIIKEEFKAYTVISLSHRLEIIMEFDLVMVLEEGTIVEMGKPKILAQTEGSRFRQLWRLDTSLD